MEQQHRPLPRVEELMRTTRPSRILRRLFKQPNLDDPPLPARFHKPRPLRVFTFGG